MIGRRVRSGDDSEDADDDDDDDDGDAEAVRRRSVQRRLCPTHTWP